MRPTNFPALPPPQTPLREPPDPYDAAEKPRLAATPALSRLLNRSPQRLQIGARKEPRLWSHPQLCDYPGMHTQKKTAAAERALQTTLLPTIPANALPPASPDELDATPELPAEVRREQARHQAGPIPRPHQWLKGRALAHRLFRAARQNP